MFPEKFLLKYWLLQNYVGNQKWCVKIDWVLKIINYEFISLSANFHETGKIFFDTAIPTFVIGSLIAPTLGSKAQPWENAMAFINQEQCSLIFETKTE